MNSGKQIKKKKYITNLNDYPKQLRGKFKESFKYPTNTVVWVNDNKTSDYYTDLVQCKTTPLTLKCMPARVWRVDVPHTNKCFLIMSLVRMLDNYSLSIYTLSITEQQIIP